MTIAVSAHRGGRETAPSASWESYRNALDIGADYLEFDVRRTSDGELVVYHDAHAGHGGPRLRDITRTELCKLVGYEVVGVRELMAEMAGRAKGHVDAKEAGYERELVAMAIDELGEDGFVVTSEDAVVAAVREAFPTVRAALSIGRDRSEIPWTRFVQTRYSEHFPRRRMRACGADSVAVHQRLAANTVLAICGRHSIEAMVWTVNDTDRIRHFLTDERVTVLVTDRPAHAMGLRAELAAAG